MLIGIFGNRGSGKTLLTTYFLLKDKRKGYRCFANYNVKGIELINPLQFFKLDEQIAADVPLSVALDEAYGWLDARLSASTVNLLTSYLIMQSRKRRMANFYYTAQLPHMIDKRLRDLTECVFFCFAVPPVNPKIFVYDMYAYVGLKIAHKRFWLSGAVAQKLWHNYDTLEVVKPMYLDKLLKQLEKIYGAQK